MAIIGGMATGGIAQNGRKLRRHWNWLLLVPVAAILFPGLYTRSEPALFGFPFFYWYQFAVVLGTALLTGLVYWQTPE